MNDQIGEKIDAFVDAHLGQIIEQIARLCNQPSVSAQGWGIEECAAIVAEILKEHGHQVEILPTDGSPVVYGESSGRSEKTLLFYAHYDVQPPEPLELWDSPPFTLTERDGKLYARGVADDKGHVIAWIAAVAAAQHALGGELPCRIKFCIEGEEEIGSPNLAPFVEKYKEKLAADGCVWESGGMNHYGAPTLYLGMRGIAYMELTAKSASRDAHSGLAGSLFANAAWRLTWALASLKDMDERILVPGFYDDVIAATPYEMELFGQMPNELEKIKESYGLSGFLRGVEDPIELMRHGVFEPTCTICGLTSGYQGAGTKTVLPAEATAKVDFRLVPNQRPDDIYAKVRAHLDAQGFEDIELKMIAKLHPAKTDAQHPFVQMTAAAAGEVYEKPIVIEPMIGGSGPMSYFIEQLGVPVVTPGISYPEAFIHAPNEHVVIEHLVQGIKHVARVVARFAD